MVDPSIKNYFDPISKKFIVGGELEVQAEGKLTVLDGGIVTGITGVAAAAGAELGGVKAAAKGTGDTVECKIDETTSKLYVPTYPVLAPAGAELGGVKAAAAGGGDTVEAKIGTGDKLYVPAYPKAANQAESTATEVAELVTDFNALLAKLKAAGLMTDNE